jgi:ribonuclease E
LERSRNRKDGRNLGPAVNNDQVLADTGRDLPPPSERQDEEPEVNYNAESSDTTASPQEGSPAREGGRRRFRQSEGRGRRDSGPQGHRQPYGASPIERQEAAISAEQAPADDVESVSGAPTDGTGDQDSQRRRRRGRRGGRRRNGNEVKAEGEQQTQPQRDNGGRWQRNDNSQRYAPQTSSNGEAPTMIPTSIHELDTTPRDTTRYTSSPDESGDKPKSGWWRRLTGQ